MIASRAGDVLRERGLTLALAESCTGGLIASTLTDHPGASSYFLAGLVTYSDRSKEDVLGVQHSTLERHGAVSSETAVEMAQGARRVTGADVGLAVTGIAGPSGGSERKPVGLVHFALDIGGEVTTDHRVFGGDRSAVRKAAAEHALGMMLERLEGPGERPPRL
jgi:PncC family amidohydrolase